MSSLLVAIQVQLQISKEMLPSAVASQSYSFATPSNYSTHSTATIS